MRLAATGFLFVALVSLAAIGLYLFLTVRAAMARGRAGVQAPATAGPPEFERAHRIQMNTLEQLVPFVVALWLCALYLQPLFAALVGVAWLVGRVIYAASYAADPAKRHPGFIIGVIATVVLVVAAIIGIVMTWLAQA
jgi:glutathione S-transferase